MFGSIVDHVASLAERGQVARAVVGRVVVQMRARGIDPGDAHERRDIVTRRANPMPSPITPLPAIGVPPSTVTEMDNVPAMRTLAMFAAPLGAAEPDQPRQLGPVDRVEPAMFGHDRHDDSMSQPSRERKQKI